MTQSGAGPTRPPRWGIGIALGALASLLGHGAFLLYVGMRLTTPDVGLTFELPEDAQFGLTEAVEVEAAEGPDTPEPPSESSGASAAGTAMKDDAQESSDDDADEGDGEEEPSKTDSHGPDAEDDPNHGFGTRALPPGAQLALRMNMTRIRSSPLASDIKELLANVPDWQAVLGGSGLEPVDDLARLLIASPNLHRSTVVIAGRHEGDADLARDIVARMANAHGQSAEWSRDEGVPVAPWPDRDATERRIALIGTQHFTISRPQDLPRVLAIAQARQAEQADGGTTAAPDPEAWAEALLSLEDDEALTLEVEGARHFVRGPMQDRFPIRMRVAIQELPTGRVQISAEGTYGGPDDAGEALAYAERVREAYASNVLLRVAGVTRVLREAELEHDGATLTGRMELTLEQIRLLLGYVEGVLARGQPRPGLPSAPGASPATEDDGAPDPNPYR